MKGRVHQLEPFDSRVGHVREDPVQNRVDVVTGLGGRIDPRMSPHLHATVGANRCQPGRRAKRHGRNGHRGRLEEPSSRRM